jgi:hypothetical protein
MRVGASSRRLQVAIVVAVSLTAGFAVAQSTGMRWLGGVVLLLGGVWAAIQLGRQAGAWRTTVVGIAYAVAFAASHPLGHAIGTWPAVLLVSAAAGAIAWLLGARPQTGPAGSRVSTTTPPVSSTR